MRKKTIEDYLELVYDLQKDKEKVHTNDIAKYFDVKPSSVTEIFQKLSKERYINYEKYGGVTLTKKGEKIASNTKEKHTKLKEFLILLGVDKNIAEKDACEMEHILNEKTMNAVIKFVEVVNKCEMTPLWLKRLEDYIKTGNLKSCPSKLVEICLKYSKTKN